MAWEEKAKEIDELEQEKWCQRVSASIVSSPWGANEAVVDQVLTAEAAIMMIIAAVIMMIALMIMIIAVIVLIVTVILMVILPLIHSLR